MALPGTIRVKISDEAGGSISFSPVVVREMPVRELIEMVLVAAGGKTIPRIVELLSGGSIVNGASRFRWQGFAAEPAEIGAVLASFPDPDPARDFNLKLCRAITFRTRASTFTLALEAAKRKRFLRRLSFFDALAGLAAQGTVRYDTYSYRDRADRFVLDLGAAAREQLRAASSRLAHPALDKHVASDPPEAIEFLIARSADA